MYTDVYDTFKVIHYFIDACGKGNIKEVDAKLILPIVRPLYGLKTPIVDDANMAELEILDKKDFQTRKL